MDLHDCLPSLNDHEVLTFCRNGYLMLEGIIPNTINEKVVSFCESHDGKPPLAEDWYIRNITLNPQVAGAVRSLLGRDFGHLQFSATHRNAGPNIAQQWHRDGGAAYGPAMDCLQVFYLPQLTTNEMGPTEVLPGSHLLFQHKQYMAHYDQIRGGVITAAPEGSIFLTAYGIWHRRTASSSQAPRNLLKFWYIRTTPPVRDWVPVEGFELEDAFHADAGHAFGRDMHRAKNDAAERFYWLCGQHQDFIRNVKDSNLPTYFGIRAENRQEVSVEGTPVG